MNHIQLYLDNEMKLLQLFHATTKLSIQKYCVDIFITKHELIFHKEFEVIFKRVWSFDIDITYSVR